MELVRNIAAGLGLLFLLGSLPLAGRAQTQSRPHADREAVEDFESYAPGTVPRRWKFIDDGKRALSFEEAKEEGEKFYVVEEGSNQFVRVYTRNEAQRLTLRNSVNFDWNLQERPRLSWRWRANQLPEGANEEYDHTNDAGAAVYVTFGSDWLGRPISIKYTYSSTLPVGTVVDYGPLMVMVIDSVREPSTGQWKTATRNVIADYRQLFGEKPPDRPVSITIWSDTDTTHGTAEVDFDDFTLLPHR